MSVNSSKLTKDKADKFNTYINKVIIFSSKEFFRREAKRNSREQKIIDNDDFDESKIASLSYNEKFDIKLTDLIDECENNKLVDALEQLSSTEKAVIFLLFSKELDRQQIAKVLDICCDTVSRTKLRALKKIKKYLKGEL